MVKFFKLRYTPWVILLLLFNVSCWQGKHLSDDEYLVHKNSITYPEGKKVKESSLSYIIRQQPNSTLLFMKTKLWVYNQVDSAKMMEKIEKKYDKIGAKNEKRKERVRRINRKRIQKAREKGKEEFRAKRFNPVPYKRTIREWLKYTVGEEPVIYDSLKTLKTVNQMNLYLEKSGYYESEVTYKVDTSYKKKRVSVEYIVHPGEPYIIDTVEYEYSQGSIKTFMWKEVNRQGNLVKGAVLDAYMLDSERDKLAEKMENSAYYGFNNDHIYYKVDTTLGNRRAKVILTIKDKKINDPNNPKETINMQHAVHYIKDIYFHLNDTTFFKVGWDGEGTYMDRIAEYGFGGDEKPYDENRMYYLLDTIPDTGKYEAFTIYNGLPFIKPKLLQNQNFLEPENYYKKYYVDRSYRYMLELGVFRSIQPKLLRNTADLSKPYLDVHYYLTPLKRQSFAISPRGTHSDGILGVSTSLNYTNLNLLRGAERLKMSVMGGFEYQPPIFTDGEQSTGLNRLSEIGFNTFEFGPKISLSIPRLMFIPIKGTSKRQQPRTEFSGTYNFQNRPEYGRHLSNLTFKYIFNEPTGDNRRTKKTHQFSPIALSFIKINTTDEFQDRIDQLNDEFLKNSFIDHFTLESIYNFLFQTESKSGDKKFRYSTQVEFAGNLLNAFNVGAGNLDENGNNTINGIPYAQFFRIDNEIVYHIKLNKKHSLHKRIQIGVGVPYGNSINMPFQNSFYAGGTTDIRAFPARTLGPGSYFDTLNSLNQIGDIRLQGTLEYRFPLFGFVKGAVFFDYGNIWMMNEDSLRRGGQFTKEFYNEIALGTGFGLRFDFDFFVIRADLGIPLHNPALPQGERWIFMKSEDRVNYNQLVNSLSDDVNVRRPFLPVINIGVNYPF